MKKKIVTITMTLIMAATLIMGCGQNSKESSPQKTNGETETETTNNTSENSSVEEVAYEDLPTITVLYSHGYDYEESVVWKEVARRVGAKIHFIGADTDKYNAMIASGEGYDILLCDKTYMQGVTEGNSLLPLDDLVAECGANITANIGKAVEYAKENMTNSTGALFWIPTMVPYSGEQVAESYESNTLIRWDLYADMGYPEVNSEDELLQLIADMMEKYPTTESGEKVYGMAIPGGTYSRFTMNVPASFWMGITDFSVCGAINIEDMSFINHYAEEGAFWRGVEFYRKAYKMGLLDPDSFIMSLEDLAAKASAGRLLYINHPMFYNESDMAEGQGFMSIPGSWRNCVATEKKNAVDFGLYNSYGINKNTEYPELCMKYLDFVCSEEGCNLILNGIEGVHYTVENGVRVITQDALEMYRSGSDEWDKTGLGVTNTAHYLGLKRDAIASDGKSLSLVHDSSLFADALDAIEKDYCEHYGVEYPAQIFHQYADKYDLVSMEQYDPYIAALIPTMTDEISRIEMAIKSEAENRLAELIFASDDEFENLKAKALESFETLGLSTHIAFYESQWDDMREKADSYR